MCSREFEVAEIAAKLIRREVDVDIGEPEKGFIALHLYSARRNKHINTAMKNARFYKPGGARGRAAASGGPSTPTPPPAKTS